MLTWSGRVRNILEDSELSGGERLVWLVPVAVFIAGGVLTLVAWWRGPGALRPVVAAFAVWTIGYWALRLVLMVGNGHSAAFVAVHTVLALVAGALAVAVLAQLRRRPARPRPAGVPLAGTAR